MPFVTAGVIPHSYSAERGYRMAFVRWRGKCAQLLATIYTEKGSKQVRLALLPEFEVSQETRNEVGRKYPNIQVDWIQISRSLAQGPPDLVKEQIPTEYQDMAEVESRLRMWAVRADDRNDANRLNSAANVLAGIRQRHYFANLLPRSRRNEDAD
jgi:hypothetical protein